MPNCTISGASGSAVQASDMDTVFSQADYAAIQSFSQKIDLAEPDNVILYGSNVQKKLSKYADSILVNSQNKSFSDVTGALESLVNELINFETSAQKPTGFRAVFSSAKSQISNIKAKYENAAFQIEKIQGYLEKQQISLLKDIAVLTHFYDLNLDCKKELAMYILAGETCLKEARDKDGQSVVHSAGTEAGMMGKEKSDALSELRDRFEKKLHDLRLSCQISLQMALQIRVLQKNYSLLVERIQSMISNTLPLWKNQMVLALGMHYAGEAMKAQRDVTNLATAVLVKNADGLKRGTVAVAQESERSTVNIEAMVKTNRALIDTVGDVIRVQAESRKKRVEAENTLAGMEAELKQALQRA